MSGFALLFAAGLAQAAVAPQQEPQRPAPQQAPVADTQTLDEVIVTAPRRQPEPQYGVLTGSGARQFEAEAARKDQMRRYRDTGSLKDYPGLRCAVFHRC